MTTESELRAACERLRRLYGGEDYHSIYNVRPSEHGYQKIDEQMIVNAYLATVPVDDGEFADDDWLESIGFSESGLRGMTILIPPRESGGAIAELCIQGDRDMERFVCIAQGMPDDPHVVDDIVSLTSLPTNLTRGDVRRLLTALGLGIGGGE